ncbi:MAG: hypothetical protein DRR42_11160 [Gammaproteobacteria bacterium]|nr:MAG: hypothetical protein DRR42_11160 [Gammaproteobacteria bacterium]
MSKCRPSGTGPFSNLEQFGVTLLDVNDISTSAKASETPVRNILISIPYEALRDNKEVQIAFQDLIYISTTE